MKNQGNVGTSNNKKKKNKKISLTALIFFLIFTVIISCVILLFVHPTFNLKDIQIEGTERYNLDDILSATNLKLNENMFLQTLGKEEIDLSKLPFVKDFSYEYKLPDKIIIRIKERTPLYIAYNKDVNKYFSIDEDGYILDEAKAERSSKEQVFVYGINFSDDFSYGDKINDIDYEKITCYENIKAELRNSKIDADISRVSFESALTTITLNDKLNVVFADDKNLKYLVAFLNGIINNIGIDTVGTIDMTKVNPTFSTY